MVNKNTKTAKVRLPEPRSQVPVRTIGQARSPFEDLYHGALLQPWWQFFVLAMSAWLAVITVFALAYYLSPGSISNVNTFEGAFYFSVQTITTIGYGVMAPVTRVGNVIVTFEALTGTLLIALLAGATFAKFARPTARVLFSARAVVSPRNGVPHLMVRMANWRHNAVIDAQARFFVLVTETTREGDTTRRPMELKLLRDRAPFFSLTWTAMHPIDEDSPFRDPKIVERLRSEDAAIFVSVTAFDVTMAQTVSAQHQYPVAEIAWNARFADVIDVRPDGARVIDYTKFHEIVPISTESEGEQRATA
jgi:inward rectifier potassium channel